MTTTSFTDTGTATKTSEKLEPLHRLSDQWPMAAYWKRFIEIGLSSVLINAFGLAAPLFSMLIYDKVIGNNILDTLYGLCLGMALLVLFDFVLRLLRAFYVEHIAYTADVEIDEKMIEQILGQHRGALYSSGDLLSKYKELSASRDALSSSFVLAIADMPFLVVYLITLGLVGGPVALVACSMGAILTLLTLVIRKPFQRFGTLARDADARKLSLLGEIAAQSEQIKASLWLDLMRGRWQNLAQRAALMRSRARFWSAVNMTVVVEGALVIWMLTLALGAVLADRNVISIGALTACSLLASRAAGLIGSFLVLLDRMDVFRRAKREFASLVDQLPAETQIDLPARAIVGDIHLSNLGFTFPGTTRTSLSDVSLRIRPGERIGVLGRNGSGKSTLLRCLAGVIRPTTGDITLDGAALHAYSPQLRAQWLCYKQQDPLLYAGTLDFNLRGDGNLVHTADLVDAMTVSGAGQMLERGELSLDMMIAAGGANLSGGQRQAIALARALANGPRMLILDEPTAGLDNETEQAVIQRLLAYTEGRTLIVATHCLALLKAVDRLIVVQDGKILADGPRHQILIEEPQA
ncbi:peptidase domain-containing ABC transporter [Herbaspirillum rubrisubalbicans]|uniref:Bacteriocin ABC transporter permease n=1 Tax=Herbaspirillum rubrisubalbicans TaxID=80842 RepID=A0AAD0XES0_9BURK|nr:ATP-binding cassette domain-containing protein [Herbaspirillum rubrisubalbicans]AYR23391.1 bacteriocin ABC transporter permease [Herbaspirillum rubrisubalbicans]